MNARQQWVAFYTILEKEIRRFMRIWQQTLLPPAITIALYFVIFGRLIGPRIGEMSGFSYIEFVVPGLIMMSVITNSYSNVVSSFFGTKFQRSIEELLVSPVPNYIILLGYVIGGVHYTTYQFTTQIQGDVRNHAISPTVGYRYRFF